MATKERRKVWLRLDSKMRRRGTKEAHYSALNLSQKIEK
jgi:hypothetical protein